MQRNRNKYLLVSFVFLTVISAALFFFSREKLIPSVDKELFRVDTDKISEVTLESPKEKVQLKFANNQWKVNDKWAADAGMIKVLFATLKQVEPRRPVASLLKDSVKDVLERTGVKVTLVGSEGSKDIFYAGGNALKTETWFMKANDPRPYSMVIPGYRVYVAGILELDESGWRNKRIFDFNERNFKTLTFTNFKNKEASFEIEMKNRMLSIKGMARPDSARLDEYLGASSLLFASRFVSPKEPGIDSIMSLPVGARIEINDIANRTFSLDIFLPRGQYTGVYGRLGDGQIVVMDRNDVGEILRTRNYFVERVRE